MNYLVDEPQYDGLGEPDQTTLIKLLNWYSQNCTPEQKKDWSIIWATKFLPECVETLKHQDPTCFFTYGALSRINLNGFPLNQKHIDKLKDYFLSIKNGCKKGI